MDSLDKIKQKKLEKMKRKMENEQNKTEVDVNDNSFEKEVIEQSKKIPVVVDFWATWCMPCLMLTPTLEKLVREYNGKFVLAKMNVDEGRLTSQKYGIGSIPSVKMFKDGKVVDEFVGARPEHAVREWLEENLGD